MANQLEHEPESCLDVYQGSPKAHGSRSRIITTYSWGCGADFSAVSLSGLQLIIPEV